MFTSVRGPFCYFSLHIAYTPSSKPVVPHTVVQYGRYDPRALRVPPKLTPCDVKSFFYPRNTRLVLWRHYIYIYINETGVWSSKDWNYRKHYCTHCSSFAYTLYYHYYCTTLWISLRICVHPVLQPFYLGYLLENYRVDRCSRRERGKASCVLTTRWFCFFQGWARGHMYKGAKPELREFRHHLPNSNRTVHWLAAAVNLILSC